MKISGLAVFVGIGIFIGIILLVWLTLYIVITAGSVTHCFGMRVFNNTQEGEKRKLKLWEWFYYRYLWWFEKKQCNDCQYFTFVPGPYEGGWDGNCDRGSKKIVPDDRLLTVDEVGEPKAVVNFGTCSKWEKLTGEYRIDETYWEGKI